VPFVCRYTALQRSHGKLMRFCYIAQVLYHQSTARRCVRDCLLICRHLGLLFAKALLGNGRRGRCMLAMTNLSIDSVTIYYHTHLQRLSGGLAHNQDRGPCWSCA
jgi:hypothetical protein